MSEWWPHIHSCCAYRASCCSCCRFLRGLHLVPIFCMSLLLGIPSSGAPNRDHCRELFRVLLSPCPDPNESYICPFLKLTVLSKAVMFSTLAVRGPCNMLGMCPHRIFALKNEQFHAFSSSVLLYLLLCNP